MRPAALTGLLFIDTSLWVEALRKEGLAETRNLVFDALDTGLAVLNGLVRTEVLRGAAARDFRRLSELLDGVLMVPLERSTWENAARLGVHLHAQGITVPTADLVVAASAMEQQATLLHRDRHYELIGQAAGLEDTLGLTLEEKFVA